MRAGLWIVQIQFGAAAGIDFAIKKKMGGPERLAAGWQRTGAGFNCHLRSGSVGALSALSVVRFSISTGRRLRSGVHAEPAWNAVSIHRGKPAEPMVPSIGGRGFPADFGDCDAPLARRHAGC